MPQKYLKGSHLEIKNILKVYQLNCKVHNTINSQIKALILIQFQNDKRGKSNQQKTAIQAKNFLFLKGKKH